MFYLDHIPASHSICISTSPILSLISPKSLKPLDDFPYSMVYTFNLDSMLDNPYDLCATGLCRWQLQGSVRAEPQSQHSTEHLQPSSFNFFLQLGIPFCFPFSTMSRSPFNSRKIPESLKNPREIFNGPFQFSSHFSNIENPHHMEVILPWLHIWSQSWDLGLFEPSEAFTFLKLRKMFSP